MVDRRAISLLGTPFDSTSSSRSRANCVEKKGSQIKGCVVGMAQTRAAQGSSRLQHRNTDYTTIRKPRRDADSPTTTLVRH